MGSCPCHGAWPGWCPPSPVWSKVGTQRGEDVINPRERVTKRSFSKAAADANVGAKLALLWMERASRYLVSTRSYGRKINTACCNVTHTRGLNSHWEYSSFLAPQGSAAEPLPDPGVSQRQRTRRLLQQRRKPAVISGVLLWSGRIRSSTLTPVIPQLQLPQLCEAVCRRSDSRRRQPGAAPHSLLQEEMERFGAAATSQRRAKALALPEMVPCQQLGCSWLLSSSGRAVVSLVSAQKQ